MVKIYQRRCPHKVKGLEKFTSWEPVIYSATRVKIIKKVNIENKIIENTGSGQFQEEISTKNSTYYAKIVTAHNY